MSLRPYCVIGVLLPLLAFSPISGQPADLISGRWTGEAGPTDAPERQPITLDLHLGRGGISGNLSGPPRPGVIRAGSFDPSTGSLRLEVSIEGSDGPSVVFEGLVVTGTALGRVTGDGIAGDFKVSRVGSAGPAPDPAAAAALSGFAQVHDWIVRAARQVSDEQWAFRPVSEVRTFGEVVAHVADSYAWYCGRASGNDPDWSDAIESDAGRRVAVVEALERGARACESAHETGGSVAILMENAAHANLHYGNLITYVRLLGLVPPSN